jgi:hypothetical protein
MPIAEEFTRALVRHRTARGGIGIGPYPGSASSKGDIRHQIGWWAASPGIALLVLNPKSL